MAESAKKSAARKPAPKKTPSVRALLTGVADEPFTPGPSSGRPAPPRFLHVTPSSVPGETRNLASRWLRAILNPGGTQQGASMSQDYPFAPDYQPDPTLDLALQLVSREYPEAAARSPVARIANLPPRIGGRRWDKTGYVEIAPTYSSLGELLTILRHELSHGMDLPDAAGGSQLPGEARDPDAYDVSWASHILGKDVDLPKEQER